MTAFANIGGIGGGEIIIPVYLYFFDYTLLDAIPLSKVTILSGAIINLLYHYNEKDPLKGNRLLIDYSLGSMIVPAMLAGTVAGVFITRIVNTKILLYVMILFVLYYTYNISFKAIEMY